MNDSKVSFSYVSFQKNRAITPKCKWSTTASSPCSIDPRYSSTGKCKLFHFNTLPETIQRPRSRVLTEACIGLPKRSAKKTAALRVSCGKPLRGTSAIGKTTAKKDSAFSITKKVTNTKECGLMTSVTARAPTGETRLAS